jgi:hypothetical protein
MVRVKVMAVVSTLFATAARSLYRSIRHGPPYEEDEREPDLAVGAEADDEEEAQCACFGARAALPPIKFQPTPTASAWMTYYVVMAFWFKEAGQFDQLLLFSATVGYAWYNYLEVPQHAVSVVCRVLSALAAFVVVAVAFVRSDGVVFSVLDDVTRLQDEDFRLGIAILGEPVFWRATLWAGSVRGIGGLPGAVISLFGIWLLPTLWKPAVPDTTHTALYVLIPLAVRNKTTDWICITATVEIVGSLIVLIWHETQRWSNDAHPDTGGTRTDLGKELRKVAGSVGTALRASMRNRRNKANTNASTEPLPTRTAA